MGFSRCNLFELPLLEHVAHEGHGVVHASRFVTRADVSSSCNFIDYVEVPPGVTIGRHTHAVNEEEFYLILEGRGTMWRDGDSFPVGPGDFVRNRPGGSHGLANDGDAVLRMFVFEVETRPEHA